jgi:AraC-like DNA-binding protein/extradiol dioxygenase family protein
MESNTPPSQRVMHPDVGLMAGVWREAFQSRDLDETRAYMGRKFGSQSRVVRHLDNFFYGHVVAASNRTSVGKVRTRAPQILRATVRAPTFYLPLHAEDHYRIGRYALRSGPRTAVLLAPGHDYTCQSQANDWMGLIVSGELLSEAIAVRRRGRPRPWRFRSMEIPVTPARMAELTEFHRRMHALAVAPADTENADGVASVERDAAAWLAGIVVEQSGEIAIPPPALHRIDRLERWVDAHLGEDITLDRLCAVSGVRWRALQKSLMALRGQSPLEWVATRRLAAVRTHLLERPAGVSISRVALDFGVTHLGRFSAAYRRAYGELPSETLGGVRSQQHGSRRSPPS